MKYSEYEIAFSPAWLKKVFRRLWGRPMIYNELQDIKTFRNRIAHHEAICFNAEGHLDLNTAREKLELIKKYLSFMGYKPVELCCSTGIRPYSLFEKLS